MLWGGMANWRSKAILRWRKARVDLRRRECILAIYIVRILKTVVLASKKNLLGNANLLEVLTRAGLSSSPGQPLRNRWENGFWREGPCLVWPFVADDSSTARRLGPVESRPGRLLGIDNNANNL